MKIYDTSNQSNSLYHYTIGLLGLPVLDTTTLTRTDFARLANVWRANIDEWIWKSQNTWQYDDTHNEDLPEATADLVDDQQNYTFPSGVFDVRGAEILDSSGNKVLLKPITDVTAADMIDYEDKDLPAYYSLKANVISLYPPPDETKVTASDGLTVYVDRNSNLVYSTTTDRDTGLPRQFEDTLALGIAKDKSISFGMPELFSKLDKLLAEKRAEIEGHFSRRHRDVRRRIIPSTRQSI